MSGDVGIKPLSSPRTSSVMRGLALSVLLLHGALARSHLDAPWDDSQDTDFDINDIADWSSIPSMKEMDKRSGKESFEISGLVDLSTLTLAGAAETAQYAIESENDLPGDHLNPSDFKAADTVTESYEGILYDPIESAKLFEGDIDNVDLGYLEETLQGNTRNAIRDSWRKWPNGVIPYVISSSFNTRERSVIAKAMKEYHENTCIRFVPRTSERGYINIMKGSGCSSSVGRTGSRQQVSGGVGDSDRNK